MSIKSIPLEFKYYIVKLGFTGVYLFFLVLIENIDGSYSLSRTFTHSHCL